MFPKLVIVVLWVLVLNARFLHTQSTVEFEASADTAGSGLCFRGRPMPTCRSFFVIEGGGYTRLAAGHNHLDRSLISVDGGMMWNLSDRSALGLTLLIGSGMARMGFRARYRYWYKPRLSSDLSVGIVDYRDAGMVSDVSLNLRDQAAVVLRAEYFPKSRSALMAGARLGSGGALIGAVLIGLGALILSPLASI